MTPRVPRHGYLFYDDKNEGCREAAELLTLHSILFTKIPSRALFEPALVLGQWSFHGMEEIVRGLRYLGVIQEDKT